ncbi:MAG: hypothetical protein R3F15_10025 [Lysobacterales bacterium]
MLSQTRANWVKDGLDASLSSRAYREWEARADGALGDLAKTLEESLKRRAALLGSPFRKANRVSPQTYLNWRHEEVRGLREAWCRLNAIRKSDDRSEIRIRLLMQWLGASLVFPAEYQTELTAIIEFTREQPTLGDRITETMGDMADDVSGFVGGLWSTLTGGRSGS